MPMWFALLWGGLATVIGVCFVVFRERVAARVQRRAVRWGQPRPLFTQSPAWFAVFGVVFALLGPAVIVLVLTGVLHTR